MKFVLLIFLFVESAIGFAQPPSIQWERCFGGTKKDQFNSLCRSGFNFAIVGETESDDGNITNHHNPPPGFSSNDVWLIVIDSTGNLLFSHCYGGQGDETGFSIVNSQNGNFFIASNASTNNGDVTGIHTPIFNTPDYWILKIDSIGNLQWQHCYGGGGDDFVASIYQTLDYGFLIAGETNSSNEYDVAINHGNFDVWMLKIDSSRNINWSICLGGSSYDAPRGTHTSIQLADSSYLIVANIGSGDGNASGYHGGTDLWVVKLSSSGQLLWQRCYGGSSLENGFAILPADGNNFYAAGTAFSNDGDVTSIIGGGDMWLIRADSSGSILWEKCFGGFSVEEAKAMCNSSDGGIAITGYATGNSGQVSGSHGNKDFWVIKVDSLGNFEWGKALGGTNNEEASDILQTPDGGYMIAGYTNSGDGDVSTNLGDKDGWVVKLSPVGMNIKDPTYSIMDLAILQSENNISVRFFSKHNQQSQIVVYNITGQKVIETLIEITEGINYYSLPQSFAKGIYSFQIKGKGFSEGKKFVVK